MSQDYSFSWSTSLDPTPTPEPVPAAPQSTETYAFPPCHQYPLPQRQVLLRRLATRQQAVVTPEVVQALNLCTRLRPLADHARALVSALPGLVSDEADARSVLESLRQTGILLKGSEVEQALNPASAPVSADLARPGRCVCIPTCDRPELLDRVLGSLLGSSEADPATEWYVIDDSRERANIAKNRAITQRHASTQRPLRHLSPDWQRLRLDQLQQRLPDDEEAIEFLLGNGLPSGLPSYGRALNHALLLSRGKTLIHLDDDVLCQGFAPPVQPGQEIGLGQIGRSARFLSPDQPWKAGGEPLDPIGALANPVGMPLAEWLAQQREQGASLRLEGSQARELIPLLGGHSRILATSCGLWGDPGTTGHQWLFALDADSLAQLSEVDERYTRALHQPGTWLGQPHRQLSGFSSLLSVVKAIDHRQLLPPAMPCLRNEDLLLGRMLSLMYPQDLFLELPFAVPHLPPQQRRWAADLQDQPMLLGLLRFTTLYLGSRAALLVAADPAERLATLGRLISELGQAPRATLEDEIGQNLSRLRADLVRMLQQRLQSPEIQSAPLRRDMEQQLNANLRALTSNAAPGLVDLFELLPDQDSLTLASGLWRSYGAAIEAWPRILRAAATLPPPAWDAPGT